MKKLNDLFEYTYHFNKEMVKIISDNLSKTDDKTVSLINHILNAQQIWNSRILNEQPFEVWQINRIENLEEINSNNFKKTVYIIGNYDIEQKIEYQNSKGIIFGNTVFEILFHVINHSTYHRGQINSQLKNSGIEPILTDYIFYKR
nr:DinB family protein [uncultured Chryseobacterium sp.]